MEGPDDRILGMGDASSDPHGSDWRPFTTSSDEFDQNLSTRNHQTHGGQAMKPPGRRSVTPSSGHVQ